MYVCKFERKGEEVGDISRIYLKRMTLAFVIGCPDPHLVSLAKVLLVDAQTG